MSEKSERSSNSDTDSTESCITSRNSPQNGLIKVPEDSNEYTCVQHRFYTSLNSFVPHCPLSAIRRAVYSTQSQKEWLEAYNLKSSELKQKLNGCANEVFAWYQGSEDELIQTVRSGFDVSEMAQDSEDCGIGLQLNPEWLSIRSLMSSPVDKNGFRHLLLCRVLLGSVEEVRRGSVMSMPSCESFDSGVDDLKRPTRYVVWYPNANKCVLPCYVLTVKVNLCRKELCREAKRRPVSPWIPLRNLIKVLSASFPLSTMSQIKRVHSQFMERKIDRGQLIGMIRQITGDRPLFEAIKNFQTKQRSLARQKSYKSMRFCNDSQ